MIVVAGQREVAVAQSGAAPEVNVWPVTTYPG